MNLVKYIIRCSSCGKQKLGNEWVAGESLAHPPETSCAYGYCLPCFDQVMEDLRQSRDYLSRLLERS